MSKNLTNLTTSDILHLLSDEDDDGLEDLSVSGESEPDEDQQATEIPDIVEKIEAQGDESITVTLPPDDVVAFTPSPGSQDMFESLPSPEPPPAPPAKRLCLQPTQLPQRPLGLVEDSGKMCKYSAKKG
jgi:hypothetical protein